MPPQILQIFHDQTPQPQNGGGGEPIRSGNRSPPRRGRGWGWGIQRGRDWGRRRPGRKQTASPSPSSPGHEPGQTPGQPCRAEFVPAHVVARQPDAATHERVNQGRFGRVHVARFDPGFELDEVEITIPAVGKGCLRKSQPTQQSGSSAEQKRTNPFS